MGSFSGQARSLNAATIASRVARSDAYSRTGIRSVYSVVSTTSPSSPGGCSSMKSCGRPASASGATRISRRPSRTLRANVRLSSVSRSVSTPTRSRVSSSRSTPPRRKSRSRCTRSRRASRVQRGDVGVGEHRPQVAVQQAGRRQRLERLHLLLGAGAHGGIGMRLTEEIGLAGRLAQGEIGVVPQLEPRERRARGIRLQLLVDTPDERRGAVGPVAGEGQPAVGIGGERKGRGRGFGRHAESLRRRADAASGIAGCGRESAQRADAREREADERASPAFHLGGEGIGCRFRRWHPGHLERVLARLARAADRDDERERHGVLPVVVVGAHARASGSTPRP